MVLTLSTLAEFEHRALATEKRGRKVHRKVEEGRVGIKTREKKRRREEARERASVRGTSHNPEEVGEIEESR